MSEAHKDVRRLQELLEKQFTGSRGQAFKDLSAILDKCVENKIVDTFQMVEDHVTERKTELGKDDLTAATIALYSSAAGYSEPRLVEIRRGDSGYGFNIMGGNARGMPIYVSRILPGGVADRQGKLKKGDQLLAINGQAIRDMSHEDLVKTMRSCETSVKMIITYAPHLLDGMEKTFETQRRLSARRQHEKRASLSSS